MYFLHNFSFPDNNFCNKFLFKENDINNLIYNYINIIQLYLKKILKNKIEKCTKNFIINLYN
jgi:hypothetical protein